MLEMSYKRMRQKMKGNEKIHSSPSHYCLLMAFQENKLAFMIDFIALIEAFSNTLP